MDDVDEVQVKVTWIDLLDILLEGVARVVVGSVAGSMARVARAVVVVLLTSRRG